MMHRLLAASVAALFLAAPAAADKFYIGSADDAAKLAEGSTPNVIEGVLLKEEGDNYVIRVEGGEITLAKANVYKVEKTALSVADLEKAEKDAAAKLAEADTRRREVQAAEASATREARDAASRTDTAMPESIVINVDFNGLLPSYRFRTGYDPVLHRVDLSGLAAVVEEYLRQEVARAHHRDPVQQ